MSRAKAHWQNLSDAVETYSTADHDRYSLYAYDPKPIPEKDRDRKNVATWFSPEAKIRVELPLPDDLATVIGDLVNNMRTALDNMACDLVALNNRGVSGVYFPFCSDVAKVDETISLRNMDRAREDVVALLKTLAIYPQDVANLRAVHDLDVHNKHHSLITGLAMGAEVTLTMPNFTIPTAVRPIFHKLGKQLAFLDGHDALAVLASLLQQVDGTVEAFAALYSL